MYNYIISIIVLVLVENCLTQLQESVDISLSIAVLSRLQMQSKYIIKNNYVICS